MARGLHGTGDLAGPVGPTVPLNSGGWGAWKNAWREALMLDGVHDSVNDSLHDGEK